MPGSHKRKPGAKGTRSARKTTQRKQSAKSMKVRKMGSKQMMARQMQPMDAPKPVMYPNAVGPAIPINRKKRAVVIPRSGVRRSQATRRRRSRAMDTRDTRSAR